MTSKISFHGTTTKRTLKQLIDLMATQATPWVKILIEQNLSAFQNPIGCRVKRTTKLHFKINELNGRDGVRASAFEYSSPDDMLGFDDPASEAAVIKACIELVGIRDFSETVRGQYRLNVTVSPFPNITRPLVARIKILLPLYVCTDLLSQIISLFSGLWSGDRNMVRLASWLRDGDFEHPGRLRTLRSLDSGGDEILAWRPKPCGNY